jgi:2-polyprenyl-3-methyl-5-hydroxy-6-metoxy-1,4-benzoquinol methylase
LPRRLLPVGVIIAEMSRYYESDDRVFQKLRAAGKRSWDEQADPKASFERFVMRPFLEESLGAMVGSLKGLVALEIGCGTGPICCFLAARGLAVRGIDVSPTALEMARGIAAERGVSVRFDLADICNMPEQAERYDLIIDGHCLHYFVQDEHRRAALAAVHRLLRPGGLFLIETMISHPGLVVGASYRFDARCVLSIKVDDPTGHEGAFTSDGEWFAPYRRLLSADQLVAELGEAGLVIRSRRVVEQKDTRKPMLMQIRAEARA